MERKFFVDKKYASAENKNNQNKNNQNEATR